MATRWTIRHGLMLLWFKELMNVTKKEQFIDPTFRHSSLTQSSIKPCLKDAFITLKNHKPNFANKPTCLLINSTKSEIGRISKTILERINNKITRASKFN